MPVCTRAVDVLKSILLLPGVTNAGEVPLDLRGGGSKLNFAGLATISIRHIFGSLLNPDVMHLKLYKGGIPARYGGRASSVLDIYQKMVIVKNFM
jgi:hypothetical protein